MLSLSIFRPSGTRVSSFMSRFFFSQLLPSQGSAQLLRCCQPQECPHHPSTCFAWILCLLSCLRLHSHLLFSFPCPSHLIPIFPGSSPLLRCCQPQEWPHHQPARPGLHSPRPAGYSGCSRRQGTHLLSSHLRRCRPSLGVQPCARTGRVPGAGNGIWMHCIAACDLQGGVAVMREKFEWAT